MFQILKRIFDAGWKAFQRQKGLSLATVFILSITIGLATSLFLFQGITQFTINVLQEKVDISVYLEAEAPLEEILAIKEKLEQIPEVKMVEYVSQEEAVARFTERHKDDPELIETLAIVPALSLPASLNIKTWQASQYAAVDEFLNNDSFQAIISEKDYPQKKEVIGKLSFITSKINKLGIVMSIILALVAVSVAFNTVRLAIYNSEQEISVMRLVGASNWFTRGPFLVQGILAGLLATIITFLVFLAGCYFFSPKLESLLSGFNLFDFFINHLGIILLIQLIAGVGLGALSSYIAVHKYLKV